MKQTTKILGVMLVLVLSISMIPTAHVSATTNTNKNLKNVVKYLKENHGYIQEEGFSIGVKGKKIYFHMIIDGKMAHAEMSKTSPKKMTVRSELLSFFVDHKEHAFKTRNKKIKISTFKSKKQYTYKYSKRKGESKSEAKTLTNYYVRTMFEGCDILLKRETGYSLKDIGFKKIWK